jgi:predicted metalloprotease with PDZ domain
MRTRISYALVSISLLLGALSLLLYLAAERVRFQHPQVVYTLTPLPSSGHVRVEVDFFGVHPGRLLLVAPDSDPSPPAGVPLLPDFAGQRGEGFGSRLWWGQVDPNGRLTLSYEVTPQSLDGRHALLYGSRTFVIPAHADPRSALFERGPGGGPRESRVHGAASRIAIRFRLPTGWDAFTPWAEPVTTVEVPGGRFARLRESIMALGDYVPRTFDAAGARVELVMRGIDPAREDELESLVRECLSAHARRVGNSLHRRLLVIADYPYRGDQAEGETSLNAAHLELSQDPGALRSRSFGRVVAHELFHFWNGGAVDVASPDLAWFAEGATEYYGLLALAATGRISSSELSNDIAGALDRLRGNSWADSSLATLGRGSAREPMAWSAVYAKGLVAAWALDLRLADSGGLDELMRTLVHRGDRPDLAREIDRRTKGSAAGFLDSLSGPSYRAALEGQLAARGLRLERTRSDAWTLGLRFFRPGTTEVIDLDPNGPAALAGIQPGDRVVWVNQHPVEDLAALRDALSDGVGDVLLGIERNGQVLATSLVPAPAMITIVTPRAGTGMATRIPPPGELLP